MKPAIFIITGTSGAGKTTLVHTLKKELPSIHVYDIDEEGVPEDVDEKWRQKRTVELMEKAVAHYKKGEITVLSGVLVPKEVQQTPSYDKSLLVYYGFIHIDNEKIRARLQDRDWPKDMIEENVNWARHLESYVKAEKNKFIIKATNKSPIEVAHEVIAFIKKF